MTMEPRSAADATGDGEINETPLRPISPLSAISFNGHFEDDHASARDSISMQEPSPSAPMPPEAWAQDNLGPNSDDDHADLRIAEPLAVEANHIEPERSQQPTNTHNIAGRTTAASNSDTPTTSLLPATFRGIERYWSRSGPWRWDVFALIFAFALFVADIAILASFDGLSLSEWHADISINTVVSTISTVAMFTLMNPLGSAVGQCKWLLFSKSSRPLSHLSHLDGASRGPYGSLKLFLRRKWYGQLIHIRFRDLDQGSAFLPIAYDYGSAGVGGFLAANLTMKAAAYAGFVSPLDTTFNVTSICPSGNCTWSPFQTLGVCKSCTDLADQILPSPIASQYFNGGGPSNFALPNGFNLTTQEGISGGDRDSMVYMNISTTAPMYSNLYGTVDDFTSNNLSIAYKDRGSLIIDIFILRLRGLTNAGDNVTFAKECILQYCVKTISAVQRNGELVETELSTWANNSEPARRFYLGYFQSDHTAWSPLYFLQPPGQNKVFRVGHDPQVQMTNWLDRQLSGTAARQGRVAAQSYVSDQIQGIDEGFNKGENRLETIMANVASAMTAALRTGSNETAQGTVFTSEPYIDIEWAWLTLPLLLYVLSICFVAVVALKYRAGKSTTFVWKNSLPAALFHGLDPELRSKYGGLNVQKDVDDRAKELHVKLMPGPYGIQLAGEVLHELRRLDGVVDDET
ncbi:hypothetical protein Q7P37_000440 [Cladosporium fusiforme]